MAGVGAPILLRAWPTPRRRPRALPRAGKPPGFPLRPPLQGRSGRRRSGAQLLSSGTLPTNSSNGTAHRGVGRPGEASRTDRCFHLLQSVRPGDSPYFWQTELRSIPPRGSAAVVGPSQHQPGPAIPRNRPRRMGLKALSMVPMVSDLSFVNGWQPGSDLSPCYVQRLEDRLCEPQFHRSTVLSGV